MIDAISLLFGIAGLWLLGAAIATLLLGRRIWRPAPHVSGIAGRAELIGLGFVLGIAGASYGQFLFGLAGGALGRGTSFAFAGIGVLAGAAAWWWCRSSESASRANNDSAAWIRLASVTIVILLAILTLQTLLTPQRLWDERAIFGLKSLVLYEDHTLHSPDLLHPDFVQYHPRYPLLIPLAEQHIYALLGRADDRWGKLVFPLMAAGLVFTFAGVLQRRLRAASAWLWALALATIPLLMFDDYGFLSGQADAPVACYHGISLLYLWSWLRARREETPNDHRELIAAGFAAALTLFTKDEGIAFIVIDTALLAVLVAATGWRTGRRFASALRTAATSVALYGGAAAVVAAAWFWHRGRLPVTTEMNYSGRLNFATLWAGIPTLAWSVPHMADRMFLQVTTMGLQWWGIVLAGFSRVRRAVQSEQLFVLGDILGALAALLVAGMIAPTPVQEHIGGSSHRFLMQLAPAAVLFIAGQWSDSADDVRKD